MCACLEDIVRVFRIENFDVSSTSGLGMYWNVVVVIIEDINY